MVRILVGCEFSGIVRGAFKAKGHDAWSCDLLPTDKPGNHIQGDILEVIKEGNWDMGIFFPPCTRLCNSGVRWLSERNLWEEMKQGAEFFKTLLLSDIPKICIENPIQHKYAREIIGVKYSQIIQPFMFGHGESKATCLWLKGLPPLMATDLVMGREQRVWKLPPSKDRWKERSRTFEGFAKAMSEQWD